MRSTKLQCGSFMLIALIVVGCLFSGSIAAAQTTVINVVTVDIPYSHYLQELLPEFEKETGIKVNLELLTFDLCTQRQQLELSSGSSAYDVMTMIFIHSGKWIGADWVHPLDEYINDPKLVENADIGDFLPASIQPFQNKGFTYALPFVVETSEMAYRKDILEEHGIEVPSDFNEVLAAAKKIHSPECAAVVFRGAPIAGQLGWVWPNFMQGFGGNLFKDPPVDLTPVINSPENAAAVKYFVELAKYGPEGMLSFQHTDAVTTMKLGKAAMWIDGSGVLVGVLDKNDSLVADKIGFAPVPAGPAGSFPQIATHGWMIPKGSRHKEAAWQFLKWATGKDVMQRLVSDYGYLPVPRESVLQSPEYTARFHIGGTDFGELQIQALKDANPAYRTVPIFPQVGDRIAIAVSEVWSGQKTVEKALNDAQRDIERIVEDWQGH